MWGFFMRYIYVLIDPEDLEDQKEDLEDQKEDLEDQKEDPRCGHFAWQR